MGIEYTPYASDTKIVQLLQREASNESEITIFRDGGKVHLISGTYTLIKPTGEKLIDASAITITGNVGYFTLSAVNMAATLQLGEGYVEEWALVLDNHSDHEHTFRRMAAVVRRRL